jgi:hypothetical protein
MLTATRQDNGKQIDPMAVTAHRSIAAGESDDTTRRSRPRPEFSRCFETSEPSPPWSPPVAAT